MTLWSAKHRKVAIFRRKMSGFEVFSGLREHEVRSNPCLMPICRATHFILKKYKDHGTILSSKAESERMLVTP